MIVFDLFEQDINFRKPVEYETRKQFGTVNFANLIKAYQSKQTQPVQFDFPGGSSYKLSAQWVDMLVDYYNTLETNADKAQLIYGTLVDYNKTIRFLNNLSQQKLFEKKSSDDDLEFKSAKLSRLKQQARAKYPAAANDMEALAADFTDSQEKDQQEFDRVRDVNRRQDELLKQITALNKSQDNEIKDLEGTEVELQRNIQQMQAANAELAKKLADMSARRSKKDNKEKSADLKSLERSTVVPVAPDVDVSTDVAPTQTDISTKPAKSAISNIVRHVAGDTDIPTAIPKANVIDLIRNADTDKPDNNQDTTVDTSQNRSNDNNVIYLPGQIQKTTDDKVDDEPQLKFGESAKQTSIPLKSVVQGYQVDYNPRTQQVTVSRRGQVVGTGINKLNSAKYHLTLINKIIDQAEEDKYPTDIDDRDVALPMRTATEGSVFGQQKFDTQMDLAKLKSQLTQPKPAQSAPADTTEPQPVAYQPPARLSDLQVRKQRVDNLASIKQTIEQLQARATRGGRELPPGLAADLEDYFTTDDIDTDYDEMMSKYQRQLAALQKYLNLRRAVWAPKKETNKMKAKELQEGGPQTWTVYFTDGTKAQVRVPNDETDPAKVRAFLAKKGMTVKKFDYGFGTEPEAGPGSERHEPGSGSARSARTGEELPEEMLDRSGQKMYQAKEVYMLTHDGQEVAFYTLKDLKRAEQDAQDLQKNLGGEVHLRKVMREGDVVSFNRGGFNAFRDKNDWLDKRDYVQQQLLDPRQRENYPELKQRLLDINSAGRKLGYTK